MDNRSHGVLINAAGCVYALLGFSLSVLAALLGAFRRHEPKPIAPQKQVQKQSKLHLRPVLSQDQPSTRARVSPIRSFSDQSPIFPPLRSFEAPEKNDQRSLEATARKRMLASHRRSRSIPLITIDYFATTDSVAHPLPDFLSIDPFAKDQPPLLSKRKGLTFVITTPPEREERLSSIPDIPERPGFRHGLSKLFTKDRPTIERRVSSPQLRHLPPPTPAPIVSQRKSTRRTPRTSDEMVSEPEPSKRRSRSRTQAPALPGVERRSSSGDEVASEYSSSHSKSKTRKTLRKVPSAPGPVQEKLTMKFDPSFTRTVEKKKSLNLRTQPYEAPYFCPPPLPIPTHNSSTTSSPDPRSASIHKNPSRSRTLK